jgi:flagellar biosynthetic protein FlhB
MADSGQDKTEAPTPRRRAEARNDGSVARSTDLTAAATLLAGVLMLNILGFKVLTAMRLNMEYMLSGSFTGNPTRPDDVVPLFGYAARLSLEAAAPIMLAVTAVALVANLMQVGFLVTGKPLMPSVSKLNPLKGLNQLFGTRAGMRLVMSLFKIGMVATVAIVVIIQDLPRITGIARLEPLMMFAAAAEMVYGLALKLAVLLLIIALIDWWYQRWQHEQDLRMTKEEVKDEMKRMEGDPQVKQRRARVARQLALQRIGAAVPKADVIITNPTHFAIALKYESANMTAPKVIAKGADFLALRIRQLAIAHGVPIVERRELARALYKNVEIGQEVPPQFYNAVAEIMAYVYRLSGKQVA